MSEMQIDYSNILDSINDGLYLVDRSRRITYWNKAAERITGFKADEVLGHCCADRILIHVDTVGCDLCTGSCPLAMAMEDEAAHESNVFLHHKEGHRIPVSVRVTPLKDIEGKIIGGCELFSDSRPQAALHLKLAELEKLALLDPLTELVTALPGIGTSRPVCNVGAQPHLLWRSFLRYRPFQTFQR